MPRFPRCELQDVLFLSEVLRVQQMLLEQLHLVSEPPRARSLVQSCFEMGHPKRTPTSDSNILHLPPGSETSLPVTGSSIFMGLFFFK